VPVWNEKEHRRVVLNCFSSYRGFAGASMELTGALAKKKKYRKSGKLHEAPAKLP
jgi:hypothetical protein